uniref:Putative ovule protein n=1 Tax=Solanum chacoense TaxID=4108 RepID=A0A0V0GTI3_SOLCH
MLNYVTPNQINSQWKQCQVSSTYQYKLAKYIIMTYFGQSIGSLSDYFVIQWTIQIKANAFGFITALLFLAL